MNLWKVRDCVKRNLRTSTPIFFKVNSPEELLSTMFLPCPAGAMALLDGAGVRADVCTSAVWYMSTSGGSSSSSSSSDTATGVLFCSRCCITVLSTSIELWLGLLRTEMSLLEPERWAATGAGADTWRSAALLLVWLPSRVLLDEAPKVEKRLKRKNTKVLNSEAGSVQQKRTVL